MAGFVVLIRSDRWWRNTDEQKYDRGWRIWNLVDPKSRFDARWPAIETLTASRNPLLAGTPWVNKACRV